MVRLLPVILIVTFLQNNAAPRSSLPMPSNSMVAISNSSVFFSSRLSPTSGIELYQWNSNTLERKVPIAGSEAVERRILALFSNASDLYIAFEELISAKI